VFPKLSPKSGKYRVAILTAIYSGFDGVSRVVEQQAKELSKMCDVTIFSLEADMETPENVRLKVLWSPRNLVLNRLYRLFLFLNLVAFFKYVIELTTFNILIAHHYPLSLIAYFTKKLFGVKYIQWHHHVPSDIYTKFYELLYIKLIEYFEERSFIVKGADIVCSISEYSRDLLLRKGGIDSIVVYNRLNEERFRINVDGKRIREKYKLGDSPILLFVGRIHPQKNVYGLIKVFKMIKEQRPDVKLIIVGKPIIDEYYKKVKSISDDSVIFAGYVSDDELPYYYAACDVYVTCSLSEGFNLPLVEAQKYGKPVIAFDIGPHREVVTNGILVEVGNIKRFVNSVIKLIDCKNG